MRRNASHQLLAALLVALAALLAGAAAASAGSLANEGGTWVFRAAPGENNDFRVTGDEFRAGYIVLRDTQNPVAVELPDGCYRAEFEENDTGTARCPAANVHAMLGDNSPNVIEWGIASWDLPLNIHVTLDGGPGPDRLTANPVGPPVTLLGGDGNDELEGGGNHDTLDAGPGVDRLDGGAGNDVVRGGEGDDELRGDGLVTGADVIDGGPGYDRIGTDWIQNDRPAGLLAISLDGIANDGHPGEGDNVVAVERFDLNEPVALVAGAEAVYFRVLNHAAASSTMVGGPAADTLIAYDYADVIDGAAGDDTIEGGYGDDRITGGPGRDTINADAGPNSCNFLVCRVGSGNDVVNIRDGEADSVICGTGNDTVVADAVDTVAPDCESVDKPVVVPPPDRRVPGGGEPPRGRGRGGGRPRRACVVPRVKAGSTVAAAKKALKKRGCRAATKRIRSGKVARGRVVKLSHRAGKRLAQRKTVTVLVSRGRR